MKSHGVNLSLGKALLEVDYGFGVWSFLSLSPFFSEVSHTGDLEEELILFAGSSVLPCFIQRHGYITLR